MSTVIFIVCTTNQVGPEVQPDISLPSTCHCNRYKAMVVINPMLSRFKVSTMANNQPSLENLYVLAFLCLYVCILLCLCVFECGCVLECICGIVSVSVYVCAFCLCKSQWNLRLGIPISVNSHRFYGMPIWCQVQSFQSLNQPFWLRNPVYYAHSQHIYLIATEQLQELNLFKTTAGPLPTMSCVCLYENVCVCLYVRVFLCVSLCVCISQIPSVFWCQFCLYDWANRLQSICSRKELRATFDSHHGYPTLCGLPLMRS